MIKSKKLALASFLTVFLIGLVLGIILERLVLDNSHSKRRRHDPGDFIFKKFTERLSLEEEQKVELKALLADIKEKHRGLRKENRTHYKAFQEEFNADFRKILTEQQIVLFDELLKEFEKKRSRDRNKRHNEK